MLELIEVVPHLGLLSALWKRVLEIVLGIKGGEEPGEVAVECGLGGAAEDFGFAEVAGVVEAEVGCFEVDGDLPLEVRVTS